MKTVTMLELLKEHGLESELHNATLTRAIATQLKAKGYIKRRQHRKVVWVKDAREAPLDIPQMAERVTRGL